MRECARDGDWPGAKKERRPKPPLRCRVSELRLRKTAVFLGLPNFVRFLRTLRLDSGRGPLRPPSLSTSFGLPAFRAFALPAAGCRNSRSWRPVGLAALACLTPVRPRPEPPSNPTFPSLSCVRSSSLLRLAPPGVYLEGSRLPLESPFLMVRPAFAEPGPGDMLRTTGAFGSVFGPPPLPSGGSAVGPVGFLDGEFKLPPGRPTVNAAKWHFMSRS